MYKATELPIGWVQRVGPGGGAFPFWLAVLTVLGSGGILLDIFSRSPVKNPGTGEEPPFMEKTRLASLGKVFLPMVGFIVFLPILGFYPLTLLYFILYMRWIGKHRWRLVLLMALVTPVLIFVVFEKWLFITLPKGVFEEYFYVFY
jgi:hypothetical protein